MRDFNRDVGAYGEAEFIFACASFPDLSLNPCNNGNRSIKVITITGLIILGIVLDLGGIYHNITVIPLNESIYFEGGPDHDRLGFRYWKNPGPFVQYQGIQGAKGRFLGWWAVLTQAAFSFIGTEIVAVRPVSLLFSNARHLKVLFRLLLERRRIRGEIYPKLLKGFTSVRLFKYLLRIFNDFDECIKGYCCFTSSAQQSLAYWSHPIQVVLPSMVGLQRRLHSSLPLNDRESKLCLLYARF